MGGLAPPPGGWGAALSRAGVGPREAAALAAFLELLVRWQRVANLVGELSGEDLLRDHVLESLCGRAWLPSGGGMVDAGSGNGFPAIPLLVSNPDLRGVLLEPRERRWAFLREAVRELGLDAEVRRERVQEHRPAEAYAAMSVRGLAEREWSPHVSRLLVPDAVLLWWGGRGDALIAGCDPVLTSPLPGSGRGAVAVWRRRST